MKRGFGGSCSWQMVVRGDVEITLLGGKAGAPQYFWREIFPPSKWGAAFAHQHSSYSPHPLPSLKQSLLQGFELGRVGVYLNKNFHKPQLFIMYCFTSNRDKIIWFRDEVRDCVAYLPPISSLIVINRANKSVVINAFYKNSKLQQS